MNDPTEDQLNAPHGHPDEQPAGADGSPKFGRLLIVLALAVIMIGVLTLTSEAYFSR